MSAANAAAAEALQATGSQVVADAVRNAVSSALGAVPGVIASGGNLSDLASAGFTGATTSLVGSGVSSVLEGAGFTPAQLASGLTIARELSSNNPNVSAIANAAAGLVNSPDATVAAKAVTLLNIISKAGNNPTAAVLGFMEATQQLVGAINAAEQAAIRRLPGTVQGPQVKVTGGDLTTVGTTDVDDLLNIIRALRGLRELPRPAQALRHCLRSRRVINSELQLLVVGIHLMRQTIFRISLQVTPLGLIRVR
jgi:hypothetical protein